ncbi:hypothetical protein MVEN_00474600 [Mycena venus]|uniref:Uncharacterized protein n=1 Tax=Mycena venus TaxID=2733690 RepID=A0A8H6YVH7_9AGAR|nr:hypothetical protein MVEN_00474600 [Mycena venus]
MRLYPVPRHERRDLSCPPQDTKQKNLTDELLTAQGRNCIYAYIEIAPCTYSVDGALTGPSVFFPDCPRSLIETISGTSTSSVQTSASSTPSSSSDHIAGSQGGANSQPAAGPPGYSNTYSSDAQIPATSVIVASSGTTGSYSSPSGAELSGSSVKKPPSPASAVAIALGIFTFLLLCLCLGFWLRRRVLLRKRRAAAVARLDEIAYFPRRARCTFAIDNAIRAERKRGRNCQ